MVAVRDCHTLEFLYLILLQISKFGGNIIIAGEVELNHLSFYVESPGAVKNDKFFKRLAAESPQMVSPKCTARIKRLYRCSLEIIFYLQRKCHCLSLFMRVVSSSLPSSNPPTVPFVFYSF
jgi:hypothetical protein